MAVELASAYLSLIPSLKTSGLPAMGDEAGASVGKRFTSGFAKVTKVGLAVGVGGALAGIGAIIKTGFGEVKDASAGTAQLAAGIKSTGNAAHVTVGGLNDLASKIQNYSGQTDDSVVSAEQLLLTFTNIKNSGPNKIFDQATVAAADMAAKMGGDASSNAIRLGKALNDPVKGITALTKVGVSFTEAQKKQVTQMVKTGDTVGAQKLILHELNTEFGGSAKAAGQSLPGQMARAKRSFEDVSQEIVTGALPVITKFFGLIQKYGIPAIRSMFQVVKAHWPQIKAIALAVFIPIKNVVQAVVGWVVKHWPEISAVIAAVWNAGQVALRATVDFIRNKVIPAIQAAVEWVVQHWPQIKGVFVAAWNFIQPVLAAFANVLKTIWTSVLMPIVGWIQNHWPQIKIVMLVVFAAIGVAVVVAKWILIHAFDAISLAIKVMSAVFKWVWDNLISPVYEGIKTGIGIVRDVVSAVATVISGAFKGISAGLKWVWDHVIGPVYGWIKTGIHDVYVIVQKVTGWIGKQWSRMIGPLASVWNTISGIFTKITDAFNTTMDLLSGGTAVRGIPSGLDPGTLLGGTSTNPSKLPGKPRAFGGPVTKGQPYIVGDGGRPELFVPNESGRIIPRVPTVNGVAAAKAGDQHFHIHGITDPESFTQAVARRQAMWVV